MSEAGTAAPGGASRIRCPACGKLNRVRATPRGTPRCGSCREPLPWIVEAGEASFGAEVEASVPVVVDLWAPWCGPCRMISPVLEGLARERAGRLKVVKVNVDEEPGLAERFGLRGVPLLVRLRSGEEEDRLAGAVPAPALADWLDRDR
ncbi:MAG TPA: thioredoxin domain-containing protein [Solirubrobacterales bacterium]